VSKARPRMFLIAGGPGQVRRRGADPLLQTVIRQAGVEKPRIAYVGAASRDNPAFRLLIAGMLARAGAGEVRLAPMCGRRFDPQKTRRVLESADMIFISGGDVEEGMSVVQAAGMDSLLGDLWRAGKPFFGVSAGSIMLAKRWVRWRDPHDDGTAELFPCLGFAPVLCDTHGEADDWNELQAMLRLCRAGATGYGIVSGSALAVSPDGTVAALGGEVHIFQKTREGVSQGKSLPAEAPAE
jgi:cyanophycinase-like exopeptidase